MQEAVFAAAAEPQTMARWWTVADVASFCDVSARTVYAWVANRSTGIPFSRPRGTKKLRFKPEAIRQWFDGER